LTTACAYVLVDTNWRSSQTTTITPDPMARIGSYVLTSLRVGALFNQSAVRVWDIDLAWQACDVHVDNVIERSSSPDPAGRCPLARGEGT